MAQAPVNPVEKRLRSRLKRLGQQAAKRLYDTVHTAAGDQEPMDWTAIQAELSETNDEIEIMIGHIETFRLEAEK